MKHVSYLNLCDKRLYKHLKHFFNSLSTVFYNQNKNFSVTGLPTFGGILALKFIILLKKIKRNKI